MTNTRVNNYIQCRPYKMGQPVILENQQKMFILNLSYFMSRLTVFAFLQNSINAKASLYLDRKYVRQFQSLNTNPRPSAIQHLFVVANKWNTKGKATMLII